EAIPVNGQDITIEYVNVENNTESNDTGTCELATGSDNLGCTMNNLGNSSTNGNKSTRTAKWFWTKSGTYKIKEIEGKDNDDTDYIYTPNKDAAGHTITLKSIWDNSITAAQVVNYAKDENTVVITYTHLDDAILPVVKILVDGNLKDTQCTRDGSTLKVKCIFNKEDVPISENGYTVKVYNKCDESANNASFWWKVIDKDDGIKEGGITAVKYDNNGNTKCIDALGAQAITIWYVPHSYAVIASETTGACGLKDDTDNGGCVVSNILEASDIGPSKAKTATLTLSKPGTYYLKEINGKKTDGVDYSYTPNTDAAGHTITLKSIWDNSITAEQVVNYAKDENTVVITYTHLEAVLPVVKIQVGDNSKDTQCTRDGSTLKVKCIFNKEDVPISENGYTVKVFNKCDESANDAKFKWKVISKEDEPTKSASFGFLSQSIIIIMGIWLF
ncbi:MAG: hypothetical protein ACRC42_01635, partial [Mycoplasma sp.]